MIFWVSGSKWLVGSSRMMRLARWRRILQRATRYFSPGERTATFVDIVTVEEEVRKSAAELGVGKIVAMDVFEDSAAFVEDFELLGVVGDGGVLAKDD